MRTPLEEEDEDEDADACIDAAEAARESLKVARRSMQTPCIRFI